MTQSRSIPVLIPDLEADDRDHDPPASILRTQAAAIADKTGGEVVGTVEAGRSGSATLAYELVLEVPSARYRYKLLRIEHGLDPYPLYLWQGNFDKAETLADEAAFLGALQSFFGSPKFRQVIVSLRALAREAEEETGLSIGEYAALSFFRQFDIGESEALSGAQLANAIERLPLPLREKATKALESLAARGFVKKAGGGYLLLEEGSKLAYR